MQTRFPSPARRRRRRIRIKMIVIIYETIVKKPASA